MIWHGMHTPPASLQLMLREHIIGKTDGTECLEPAHCVTKVVWFERNYVFPSVSNEYTFEATSSHNPRSVERCYHRRRAVPFLNIDQATHRRRTLS